MSFAFDQTLMPSAGELATVRSSAEPYLSSALADDPRKFFAGGDDVTVPDRARTGTHRRIPGGTIVTHELASAYAPFHPLSDVERHESNDWIPVEHWVHDRPAPATAIALHGFTMGNPSVDAAVLMVADWFRLGLDVALVTLPFHGTRRPPNARYSGELFASWHVGRLNEAVRQSIHDVQRVAAWLQQKRASADVGQERGQETTGAAFRHRDPPPARAERRQNVGGQGFDPRRQCGRKRFRHRAVRIGHHVDHASAVRPPRLDDPPPAV